MIAPGTLDWQAEVGDLVAEAVASLLVSWPRAAPSSDDPVRVLAAPIDPALADTAAFCERYDVAVEDSANCVIIAGRRGDTVRYAACVVLANTRADVNGVVRRRLDARKASFAAMDDAVSLTGMEYGGITPIGLPADWPVLIDTAVLERDVVIVGSGLRRSKIAIAAATLAELPGAEVVPGLAD